MVRTLPNELGQGDSNYSVGIAIQLHALEVFKKSYVISSRALKAIHIPHTTYRVLRNKRLA